ncbi:hypothetical protein [Streptomyces cinereoruber]|uniref:hypothetical protein n=2 Tax=Streptomyces cinereoruber TaxID=67260 RepID=UPI0036426671
MHKRLLMRRWLLHTVVRYVPAFLAGYAVAAAVAPPFNDTSDLDFGTYLPFWESYVKHLEGLRLALPVIGGVSLVLLGLFGAGKTRGSVVGFRVAAAGLLQIPLLPFALAGGGDLVGVLMLTQIVFAAVIMPKPQLAAS